MTDELFAKEMKIFYQNIPIDQQNKIRKMLYEYFTIPMVNSKVRVTKIINKLNGNDELWR